MEIKHTSSVFHQTYLCITCLSHSFHSKERKQRIWGQGRGPRGRYTVHHGILDFGEFSQIFNLRIRFLRFRKNKIDPVENKIDKISKNKIEPVENKIER